MYLEHVLVCAVTAALGMADGTQSMKKSITRDQCIKIQTITGEIEPKLPKEKVPSRPKAVGEPASLDVGITTALLVLKWEVTSSWGF